MQHSFKYRSQHDPSAGGFVENFKDDHHNDAPYDDQGQGIDSPAGPSELLELIDQPEAYSAKNREQEVRPATNSPSRKEEIQDARETVYEEKDVAQEPDYDPMDESSTKIYGSRTPAPAAPDGETTRRPEHRKADVRLPTLPEPPLRNERTPEGAPPPSAMVKTDRAIHEEPVQASGREETDDDMIPAQHRILAVGGGYDAPEEGEDRPIETGQQLDDRNAAAKSPDNEAETPVPGYKEPDPTSARAPGESALADRMAGSQLLHERNRALHVTQDVETVVRYLRNNGEAIPNEPAAKIAAYLGFLANQDYVNDGILTGDQESMNRQVENRVIRAVDVPESYFELRRRMDREQGRGDTQITPEKRQRIVTEIQADQRSGLRTWAEYLGGNDGSYPDWFRYYTWTSLARLGAYDEAKGEFQRRSRGTVALYPELNREALSYVYEHVNKARVELSQSPIDLQHRQLLYKADFGELYAHALSRVARANIELREETRGSWTKFDHFDDPDAVHKLVTSLQDQGTGWCTAGETTAQYQLGKGNLYVYYTRDRDGQDTVPRIAIRTEGDTVVEVRGVNAGQELEVTMADIAARKLSGMPFGEEYIRSAQDMKQVTAIERKLVADPDTVLTHEEIHCLYELDHEIVGFGYGADPRPKELRALRGDRDRAEIARMLPELIREQTRAAYEAYRTVAGKLHGAEQAVQAAVAPIEEFERLFAAKDREWQEKNVYDYLVERVMTGSGRFTLIATPDIAVSTAQIMGLIEDFGRDQPHETYIDEEVYHSGHYSAHEWSGNSGIAAIRISLMPSRPDEELDEKTTDELRQLLRQWQTAHPELHARVPSLLDAVMYWHSLRAQGDKLVDRSSARRTYISHFDLEPQQLGQSLCIPASGVWFGATHVNTAASQIVPRARLALG